MGIMTCTMTRKLNQVLATEKSIKAKATSELSEAYKKAQKPALFTGFTKNYTPRDEEGDGLPPEQKLVEVTTESLLKAAMARLIELYDITATKDLANCHARADVIVDGEKVLEQLPPPLLIFLEKQLVDFQTLVSTIPVLDPAETWTLDESDGMHRSGVVTTTRTKKVQRALVLIAPTEHHPGQAEKITEDEIVGDWTTVKVSGAMPARAKARLLERVEVLLRAVKEAREEANTTSAPQVLLGRKVFDFLLQP